MLSVVFSQQFINAMALLTPDELLFLQEVAIELVSAKLQYPDAELKMTAATEELGEVAEAILDKPWSEVRLESIQVASTICQLACLGDESVRSYRIKHNLDYPVGQGVCSG